MLTVETKIDKSKIDGIGLYAKVFIPKGTVVWRHNDLIDLLISKEEADTLSEPSKKQFYNYAYFDIAYEKYLLCGDDGRFFNHSTTPNCDDSQRDVTVALRDINPGEELTVDYSKFYGDFDRMKVK